MLIYLISYTFTRPKKVDIISFFNRILANGHKMKSNFFRRYLLRRPFETKQLRVEDLTNSAHL